MNASDPNVTEVVAAYLPKGESPEDGFSDSLLLRPVEVRDGTHQLACLLPPTLSLCLTVSQQVKQHEQQKHFVTNSSYRNNQ